MSDVFDDPRIGRGMAQQNALLRRRLSAGARIVGWKVGFGAPAAKEKLRLSKPLVGFLLDTALVPNAAEVSLSGWQKPVAEPEIAVYLGRDVPPSPSSDAVGAAIAALGPAIELAEVDSPMDDVEAILSGDIFQRHVVLGPRDAGRAGGGLAGLTARVTRSGAEVHVAPDLESNTGRLLDIVQHVADVASKSGEGLRAGQFIIAGSLTPPLFLETSDADVRFTLDPIGDVSVRLADQLNSKS